ncbi:MAG: hypothetical protein ACI8UD_000014 [Planctomycetota bacterium]|jgi:hypothetical protein
MSRQIFADNVMVRFRYVVIAVVLALVFGLGAILATGSDIPLPQRRALSWAAAPSGESSHAEPLPEMTAAGRQPLTRREAVSRTRSRSCVGRCVDWQTRLAIAGCLIRAGDHTTESDASGRFELDVADGDVDITATVTVTAADRIGVTRTIEMQSQTFELNDVALRAAGRVAGLLADDRGQPCANRVVTISPAEHVARDDGWQELLQLQQRTNADGSFRFAMPTPAGAMHVRVQEVPSLLGEANHVLLASQELYLSLRCRSWHAHEELRGLVHDGAGEPVVDALVQVFAAPSVNSPVLQAAHSDSLGRFSLIRKDAGVANVWLRTATIDGILESGISGPHAWGDSDVRVQLSRTEGVWLHVADATTGSPIEQFAVQHARTSGVRSAQGGAIRYQGSHPSGKCWLEGIGAGSHEIIVWPAGARWLPNLPHAFTLEPGTREVRVSLARAKEFPVSVLTATGHGVPGVSVQLLMPADNQVVRDLAELLQHGGSRVRPNVRLATAYTDQFGFAMLRWMDSDRAMQLRVEGLGIAPQIKRGVHLRAQGVTIRVADTGALHATLHGAAGMRIELTREDCGTQLPTAWSAPLQLDADAQLRVNVPVGDWFVRLATRIPNGKWQTLPDAIAKVAIRPGVTSQLEQSVVTQLAPCEYTGRAFVDGRPARHVALLHGVDDGNGGVRTAEVSVLATNDRGEFRFSDLRAGYYAVELRMTCLGQQVAVSSQDWRRLSGGQHVNSETMSVTTATMTIALRDTSHAAVTTGQLLLRGANGCVLMGSPNAHGLVTFEGIPVSSYELQLRRSGEAQQLGRVSLASNMPEPQLFVVR